MDLKYIILTTIFILLVTPQIILKIFLKQLNWWLFFTLEMISIIIVISSLQALIFLGAPELFPYFLAYTVLICFIGFLITKSFKIKPFFITTFIVTLTTFSLIIFNYYFFFGVIEKYFKYCEATFICIR